MISLISHNEISSFDVNRVLYSIYLKTIPATVEKLFIYEIDPLLQIRYTIITVPINIQYEIMLHSGQMVLKHRGGITHNFRSCESEPLDSIYG